MTLDTYLTEHEITEASFAGLVGATQSTINRMRRQNQIPNRELMMAIYNATNGMVRADDFFGIGPERAA